MKEKNEEKAPGLTLVKLGKNGGKLLKFFEFEGDGEGGSLDKDDQSRFILIGQKESKGNKPSKQYLLATLTLENDEKKLVGLNEENERSGEEEDENENTIFFRPEILLEIKKDNNFSDDEQAKCYLVEKYDAGNFPEYKEYYAGVLATTWLGVTHTFKPQLYMDQTQQRFFTGNTYEPNLIRWIDLAQKGFSLNYSHALNELFIKSPKDNESLPVIGLGKCAVVLFLLGNQDSNPSNWGVVQEKKQYLIKIFDFEFCFQEFDFFEREDLNTLEYDLENDESFYHALINCAFKDFHISGLSDKELGQLIENLANSRHFHEEVKEQVEIMQLYFNNPSAYGIGSTTRFGEKYPYHERVILETTKRRFDYLEKMYFGYIEQLNNFITDENDPGMILT